MKLLNHAFPPIFFIFNCLPHFNRIMEKYLHTTYAKIIAYLEVVTIYIFTQFISWLNYLLNYLRSKNCIEFYSAVFISSEVKDKTICNLK